MAVWNCLWHCMRQLSAAFTANNFSWCQFVRSHHWTKRTIVWFISFGWLCFSFSNCHIASVAAKKLFGEKFTTFHLDRVTIIMTWRGEQIHRKIQMFFHLTNIKQKQWKYQHDKSEKNERVKKKVKTKQIERRMKMNIKSAHHTYTPTSNDMEFSLGNLSLFQREIICFISHTLCTQQSAWLTFNGLLAHVLVHVLDRFRCNYKCVRCNTCTLTVDFASPIHCRR